MRSQHNKHRHPALCLALSLSSEGWWHSESAKCDAVGAQRPIEHAGTVTHSHVMAASQVLFKAVREELSGSLPGACVILVEDGCCCLHTGNELSLGLIAWVPVAVVRALHVVAVMWGVLAFIRGVLAVIGGV